MVFYPSHISLILFDSIIKTKEKMAKHFLLELWTVKQYDTADVKSDHVSAIGNDPPAIKAYQPDQKTGFKLACVLQVFSDTLKTFPVFSGLNFILSADATQA